MIAVLVFLSTFSMDMLWVLYIKYIESNHPVLAGISGSVLYLLSGYVVIAYVENTLMLIPAVIGAFCGTYFTVVFFKKFKICIGK